MRTAVCTEFQCPGCSTLVELAHAYCLGCGIWLAGPQGAELRWIDGELGRVDAARTRLISRRAVLLDELSALRREAPPGAEAAAAPRVAQAEPLAARAPAPEPIAGERPTSTRGVPRGRPPGLARRPEVSARTAARVLLAAGAALVVIAVIAFTVANWATIGALGRFGILLAATAIVLVLPPVLVRRALNATAESVAAIGLGLTVADAFLLGRAFPGASGPIAAAVETACLAALCAAYGVAVRVTGPRLAAIGLAQLPAPLAAVGLAGAGAPGLGLAGPVAVALVMDSAVGLAIAERAERRGLRAEALVASAATIATWSCGALVAAGLAATEGRPGGFWLSAALVAAAAVAIAGPRGSLAELARPAAAVAGALLAVGLAVPVTGVAPGGWGLAAVSGCAGLVATAALVARRGTAGRAEAQEPEAGPAASAGPATAARRAELAAAGAAAVLAGTVVLAVPAAMAGLLPARWPLPGWSAPAAQYTAAGFSAWPGIRVAAAALALTAVASWQAPAPARVRGWTRAAGVAAAALAVAALPAAAHLAGWAALAALTAPLVLLLAGGTMPRTLRARDDVLARACLTSGTVLAASAALRSLGTPAQTIAELAVLTVAFCAAAALARRAFCAALATAGGLAAVTGLACAVPLACGWPARSAAFAALAVAVAAIGVATRLRTSRPVHSVVLDVGATAIALLCAMLTAGQQDQFALVAVAAALAASTTAWFRAGARRQLTLIASASAALAALTAQWRPLATALFAPARMITRPWRGSELAAVGAGRSPGLALAVIVLAVCVAAVATAAGAWRASGRASLDAVALALPVVAALAGVAGAAGLGGGLGYWLTVGTLLALTLALTAWAASGGPEGRPIGTARREPSPVPAAAALIAAALTVSWALAAPAPTLIVLACLMVAYPLAAWRARQPVIKVAAAGLSVVAAGGLAECAVLAAGGAGWLAGQAALGVAATAQAVSARIAAVSVRRDDHGGVAGGIRLDLAAEGAGWLMAAIGLWQSFARPETAGLALAVVGLTCLGIAARPARRAAFWPGLALLDAASCCWLAAAGVSVIEPYTILAAVIALAFGMNRSRRDDELGSWLVLGPGLALLLLPSLIGVWLNPGSIRPALLGLAAAGVALAGARAGKQAPLVAGIVVVVLDAGRALTPAFAVIIRAVPGWVPIAALGAVLLWAGATYEARLRDLRAIRSSLAAMN